MLNRKIDYLLYGLCYVIKTKVFRQEIPFIGGLVINEKCNLNCIQCKVANRDLPDLSFEEARKGLKTFYDMGIRSVFIEGGEPFLWKDNKHQLEDIVILAREVGFKVVTIYTNGTLPIRTSADTVFVSLDGLKNTNDKLRGDSYDRVMKNITESTCSNININFTINKKNCGEIEEFCNEMQEVARIKGIFFYFHTPYYGTDDLFLNLDERREIIKRIVVLKKRKIKILNSYACLKTVYRDNWIRPSKICYVYANNELYQCCRAIGNKESCANCGYLGYPEIIHILQLRLSSILAALNYLPTSEKKIKHIA